MEQTSIVLRVQRTVLQDAYIAVPITAAIMKPEPEPDGSYRIDFDAFVREAIELAGDSAVEWRGDTEVVQPHPTQQPVPADRKVFHAVR